MPRTFVEASGLALCAAYVVPDIVAIAVICRSCGHTAELTRKAIEERGLSYRNFREYEGRLKCTECGARGGRITTGHFRP